MAFDLVYASLPLVIILAYLPHFYKGYLIVKLTKKYDNKEPRKFFELPLAKTPEAAPIRRAKAAHENGLETFPSFAAAVLATQLVKIPTSEIQHLTSAYVVFRFLYNYFYIAGDSEWKAGLRSVCFLGGMGITLRLFYLAATQ